MAKDLTRLEALKAMRVSTAEGMIAVCWGSLATGVVPQGLALALGATPLYIGLLGAVQALASIVTLFGAWWVVRLPERRGFTYVTAGAGRSLWLVVAFAALLLRGSSGLTALFIAVTLSAVLVNLGVPAWTSWMNDLVPEGMRGRYFSQRSIFMTVVAVIVGTLSGRLLDVGTKTLGVPRAYFLFFLIGGILGLIDMAALRAQAEPTLVHRPTPPKMNGEYFMGPLRSGPFARFLVAFTGWTFAQSIANPFFTVYMLETLRLTFFEVQIVNGVSAVFTVLASKPLGYLVDKYGNRPLYSLAYVAVTIAPFFWVLTRTDRPGSMVALLLAAQFLSGVTGAALGLTQFNLLLGLSPAKEIARYSAVWSTVVGVAGFVGPLLGGLIANATRGVLWSAGGLNIGPYKIIFLVSAALRLALIPLLRRISEPESENTRRVLTTLAASKPLSTLRHLRRLNRATAPVERERSVEALGRIGDRLALEELVQALNDPVLTVRRQAATSLGEMGDEGAVLPLIEALRFESGVRVQAAQSLGRLGDDRAFPALLRALEEDEGGDPAFVQAAAQALGKLGNPNAAGALLEIAEEPDHPARTTAIESLGDLGSEAAAAPLTKMLQDDDSLEPADISALGDALARIGSEEAVVPLLERMSEFRSPFQRRELASSIGALLGGTSHVYEWLGLDPYARDVRINAMMVGHLREFRRKGRDSSATRIDAAINAIAGNDTGSAVRHLRVAARKAYVMRGGPAEEALEWLAAQAHHRPLSEEEVLVALSAFDALAKA